MEPPGNSSSYCSAWFKFFYRSIRITNETSQAQTTATQLDYESKKKRKKESYLSSSVDCRDCFSSMKKPQHHRQILPHRRTHYFFRFFFLPPLVRKQWFGSIGIEKDPTRMKVIWTLYHLPISADLLSIILYIALILWSVFPIHLSVLSVLLTTASLWKIRCHLEFIFVCRLGSPPSSFPFVSRLQATVPSSFGFFLGLLFLCRPILPFSFTFPFQNILIFPSPVQNTSISRENSLAKSSHPRQTTNFQSKLRS